MKCSMGVGPRRVGCVASCGVVWRRVASWASCRGHQTRRVLGHGPVHATLAKRGLR